MDSVDNIAATRRRWSRPAGRELLHSARDLFRDCQGKSGAQHIRSLPRCAVRSNIAACAWSCARVNPDMLLVCSVLIGWRCLDCSSLPEVVGVKHRDTNQR